jgi:hypothetical protein
MVRSLARKTGEGSMFGLGGIMGIAQQYHADADSGMDLKGLSDPLTNTSGMDLKGLSDSMHDGDGSIALVGISDALVTSDFYLI